MNAEMQATVYNHPDAEPTFYAAFNELDLNQLFGETVELSLNVYCKCVEFWQYFSDMNMST